MKRELRWSKTARQTYLDLLLRLQDDWSTDRAVVFAERVDKILNAIQEMPYQYPAAKPESGDITIRRCVLSKQTTLYYRVENQYVDLIVFLTTGKTRVI